MRIMGPQVHILIMGYIIGQHSWALCNEHRGVFHMRAQVSEVVILTQFARKLNLMFRILVPPSIAGILVISIGIFIPIPTLTIVFTLFLFLPGCWLPFWSDDFTESTLAIWVG